MPGSAPGSPAGTCTIEVDGLGDGFVLTDADGYAVIDNLVMGKYTVKVRAPGGEKWIQTTTIEGQPGIDAWVKPNEPQFFTEFGPPGPHVEVGFTRAIDGPVRLPARAASYTTINGRVTNLRQSRPPAVAQFSGAPFTHTRAWVALNSGATGGDLLYTQPTNEDGTFTIAARPAGQLSAHGVRLGARPDHRQRRGQRGGPSADDDRPSSTSPVLRVVHEPLQLRLRRRERRRHPPGTTSRASPTRP